MKNDHYVVSALYLHIELKMVSPLSLKTLKVMIQLVFISVKHLIMEFTPLLQSSLIEINCIRLPPALERFELSYRGASGSRVCEKFPKSNFQKLRRSKLLIRLLSYAYHTLTSRKHILYHQGPGEEK